MGLGGCIDFEQGAIGMRAFQVEAQDEWNSQVWKQRTKLVVSTSSNTKSTGELHCLVDHVERETWCCAECWDYKDRRSQE